MPRHSMLIDWCVIIASLVLMSLTYRDKPLRKPLRSLLACGWLFALAGWVYIIRR